MRRANNPRNFLHSVIVLAAGLAGSQALQPSASAQESDAFRERAGGWQTYANGRFGMQLDFPADVFSPQAPPENGDGRTFRSSDATLQVFAFQNSEGDDPVSLKQELVGGDGYDNVTYGPTGRDWLVLSGFRGDTIFYEKYFFRDGVISAFGMEFPRDRKPHYAPIVERIEDSFRAARAD
jgi:hypothetical protein